MVRMSIRFPFPFPSRVLRDPCETFAGVLAPGSFALWRRLRALERPALFDPQEYGC
jgi:hypothetical protein